LLCIAGLVIQVALRLPTATGQDLVDTIFFALLVPLFSVLAATIMTRQPGNRVGWLMMIVALGAVNPTVILTFLLKPPAVITPAFWLLLWIDNWSWIPFVFPIFLIPLHFPTGHPPSPRWNWVTRLALGLWVFFMIISLFVDSIGPLNGGWEPLPNPYGFISEKLLEALFGIPWFIGLMTVLLGSVASLIVRYRRAQQKERQQIKWLLYAGALFVVVYASLFFDDRDNPKVTWNDIAFFLSILAMPVAITIAILRYQLFDIDFIIRKTASYAVLTALLAMVYFGSVVLMQTVVGRTTGEQSPLIIVLSTLLIAALFTTLRRRVQTVIDRRFYRGKYDAQRELDRFARTARDEVALDALERELLRVVQETMQPDSASIWLKPADIDER
jgi:hypothetical protein